MVRMWIILVALLLAGCESGPVYPLRSHALASVNAAELPRAEALPVETSFARWKAKSSRLVDDVPRAVKRSDWGLLELKLAAAAKAGEKAGPLRAEALLPDNRTAVIHAWAIGEDEVAAGVMIGKFGDAAVQREFLQMLADVLADKPKPKRGGLFFLPEF